MINELAITNQLIKVLQEHLNEYLIEAFQITKDQVVMGAPDVDKAPFPVTIYVEPDYSQIDGSTTCSDSIDFRLTVWVICKRDTQMNLMEKQFVYYNSIYYLLRNNTTLDGFIPETKVIDADFDLAVEANPNVRGSDIQISISFEKDF